MISGKIAATTIISKKSGLKEFRRFMINLNKMFLFARVYNRIPLKKYIVPAMFKIFNDNLPIFGSHIKSIPGFTNNDCFRVNHIEIQ